VGGKGGRKKKGGCERDIEGPQGKIRGEGWEKGREGEKVFADQKRG